MCLDFLSCPMCRSHSASFWISLREVGLCTAIYSVHLWKMGKSGAPHIAILVMPSSPGICRFERIYRKSLVETWCVVDEEMGLERWYDLLRVSETKNGSHSSDLSEGRTFLVCLWMDIVGDKNSFSGLFPLRWPRFWNCPLRTWMRCGTICGDSLLEWLGENSL